MSPESLRVRVERLEQRVEILGQLPDRVSAIESQIVLLRDEMRSEFSATRARDEEARRALTERMDSQFGVLSKRMDSLADVLSERMDSVSDVLNKRVDSVSDVLNKRMDSLSDVLNKRMDSLCDVLNKRMDSLSETLSKQMVSLSEILSDRMVSLFDANERHMRLLHEDLVQRIATIREGRS